MSNSAEFRVTAADLEAMILEKKRRSAERLLDQLTQFADSISADASGDGEFDVELRKSLYISRACLLRWFAIHAQRGKICATRVTDIIV
jgi:hypothetical protein